MALHKKIILPAVLSFSLMLQACSGSLSEKERQKVNSALNDSFLATTETTDVDMEIMENGLKKVHLTGSYAKTYNTDELNETRIKGPVYIEIFDSTGGIKTRVDANRAIYRAEAAEFELFGNVKVNTRTNRTLYSEYLKWNQKENIILTPEFVVITTANDSIAGTGFRGTADLSNYTIQEPSGQVVLD